jgi:hypothetical protein
MATLSMREPAARQFSQEIARTNRLVLYAPWALLLAYLALVLPLFVCEGLHSDVTMWDLNTRTVLRGGVLYRDTDENNFPGMLWPLLIVRSTLGWSSEALRLVDFGIVSTIAWLLTSSLPARSAMSRAASLFVLYAFYLSTSEWCHCQRDTWMLLPAVAALWLRCRQANRLANPRLSKAALLGWAILEGAVWALGFWIKPFVAVPCLACWIVSAWLVGTGKPHWGRLFVDGSGVIAGGLVAGAVGICWMIFSGTWPWFWEVMLVWNREYVAYDMTEGLGWMYFAGFVARFFPWVFIHAAAIPIAVRQIWRMRSPESSGRTATALLAGFYLAWFFQAAVLQHLFDYIHAPAILLGLAVVMGECLAETRLLARAGFAAFVLIGLCVNFPAVYANRHGAWTRCLQEGSTPQLRDRLTLIPIMNWSDLDKVRGFLAAEGVQDGELTCFSMRTSPLYLQLDLQPPTRHIFVQNALTVFVRQRGNIHRLLADSRQRFVVFDLFGMRSPSGEREEDDPDTRPLPAMWQSPSRWADKVVFRAGRYVLFAIDGADMPAWLDECFHL